MGEAENWNTGWEEPWHFGVEDCHDSFILQLLQLYCVPFGTCFPPAFCGISPEKKEIEKGRTWSALLLDLNVSALFEFSGLCLNTTLKFYDSLFLH